MDRFMRGFIAAIPGWALMNVWSYLSYTLGISQVRYIDWLGVFIYGNLPQNFAEGFVALIIHLIFVGVLSVVFTYLVPNITSEYIWLKAIVYGIFVGVLIYALPVLFKTPYLMQTHLPTLLTDYSGAALWAVTMAYTLRYLDNRIHS